MDHVAGLLPPLLTVAGQVKLPGGRSIETRYEEEVSASGVRRPNPVAL